MVSHTTAAAIIAGGRARRFGGLDKSRLVVEGQPIIVRQAELLQPLADDRFVVASAPEPFADIGWPVHPDRVAGAGALGGIFTALEVAVGDPVIVIACDLPFLDAGLLRRLVALSADTDGAWVRSARGVEPLVACYRRSARLAIRHEIDAGRLKAARLGTVLHMAEMSLDEVAMFGPPERLLANVNTPEDYARVQYRAQ